MYSNFTSDFFEDILRQSSYGFNRPMYERKGWVSIEKDGKAFVFVNVLGINEKDIDVSVNSTDNPNHYLLSVSGKTKNELLDKEFSTEIQFTVFRPMKEVLKSVENGLLTLEIEFEEPVKPKVSIRNKS